jgi:hypothetical protein
MRLHILTAVTRPENLPEIGESIMEAKDRAPQVDLTWHRLVDLEREFVGGQVLKNRMLNNITDGWVCILDDDTIMHHQFLRKVSRKVGYHRYVNAIVVSQRRTTGVVLKAAPENMEIGKVDAGQVVIRRNVIGNTRIPEYYAGDGEWIQDLLYGQPDVLFMPDVLSLHNALSGIDVSETPERMGA